MAVLFAEMRWNTFTFDMSKLFAQIDNRVQMAGETTDPLGGGPITVNGVDHAYTTDSFSFAKIFALGPDRNTGFGGDGITINATDEVTAGQAEILGVTNNAGLNYNIAGFSVGLTNLYAASLTTDLSDDRALQQLVFAGDDYVDLEFSPIPGANAGGNIFSSGAGRDYILSADGNDTLNGGDGDDIIQSANGNDDLVGGMGNDMLFAAAGRDLIEGGQGKDILAGGANRDTLIGGGGGDRFVFAPGGGQDVVEAFEDGLDRIVIAGSATGFAGLTLTQGTGGVQVSFSDSSFVLQGMLVSDLSAADFIFGANRVINTAADRFFADWSYCA